MFEVRRQSHLDEMSDCFQVGGHSSGTSQWKLAGPSHMCLEKVTVLTRFLALKP